MEQPTADYHWPLNPLSVDPPPYMNVIVRVGEHDWLGAFLPGAGLMVRDGCPSDEPPSGWRYLGFMRKRLS